MRVNRHKRKKHKYFRKKREKQRLEHPHARFPRLLRYPRVEKGHESDLELIMLMNKMREEFPGPYYDPWRDGSFNPSEVILTELVDLPVPKLKERAVKHGLSDEGTRFQVIKRIWLHYRAWKLKLGFPYMAYGPGFEKESNGSCACSQIKADSDKIKRFPRLPIRRFPRLPMRFPRLADGLNTSARADTAYMEDLRKNAPKRYRKIMIAAYGKEWLDKK